MKTAKNFGKIAAIAGFAASTMSTAANAHNSRNHDARSHDRTIFTHPVAQKCNTIIEAPAAAQVVTHQPAQYVAPVTTMIPTTTYETVTENVCTPVTRQVPTITYVPSTTSMYDSGTTNYYVPSTPTQSSYTNTTRDSECQSE